MQRRDFLQHSSLALAGTMILPDLLAGRETILGHGARRYRVNTRWSQADAARFPVKDCHEMVQDRKGRLLLLTNDTRNNVLVYDKNGALLDAWGHDWPGAHGFTLSDENGTDTLLVCDTDLHQVFKTSIDGKVLLTLDYPREAGIYDKKEDFVPTETAVAPNGDIYVADGYGKDFILHYNAQGQLIRWFGGRGTSDAHLHNAHGICVDTRIPDAPRLIVSSRQQNAFKIYTLDGQWLKTIPLPGAWVCRPVVHGDYLYAAVLQSQSRPWQQSGFIVILDKNDQVISCPAGSAPLYREGIPEEMYQTVQAFQYPHDVCVDDDENIYVAQWNSGHSYPVKLTLMP